MNGHEILKPYSTWNIGYYKVKIDRAWSDQCVSNPIYQSTTGIAPSNILFKYDWPTFQERWLWTGTMHALWWCLWRSRTSEMWGTEWKRKEFFLSTCSQERAFISLFSLAPRSFRGEAHLLGNEMDLKPSDYKTLWSDTPNPIHIKFPSHVRCVKTHQNIENIQTEWPIFVGNVSLIIT